MHMLNAVWLVAGICMQGTAADEPAFSVEQEPSVLIVRAGEQKVLRYVYRDEAIPRPYFCDVHTPSGLQVTRHHPPAENDLQDHATFHPGIWLAFGDLSGADSWRGKAAVEHVEFVEEPAIRNGSVSFRVRNRYWNPAHDAALCDEVCHFELSRTDNAYLLTLDSRFTSECEFAFGDQEEMGLGVRMATALVEKQGTGALITDSEFRTTARSVWGHASDWCDYSGAIERKPVGVTLLSHPENVRRPWWHARDYGLLVANPFGQQAFTGGDPGRLVVAPGNAFRLRYGIVIHDGRPGAGYDPRVAYEQYAT